MDSKPRLRPALFLPAFPHPTTTSIKYHEKILLLKCTENGELTKVLTAHSFGNGNNIRIINFDNNLFPTNKFLKGSAIVQEELLDSDNKKIYYYTAHNKNNEEIVVNNDIVHRYAGLTIYIRQIKNRKVKIGYYYNFRTWKFKNFQFINNSWKEISDAEYDRF